jgi:hypothetical protein
MLGAIEDRLKLRQIFRDLSRFRHERLLSPIVAPRVLLPRIECRLNHVSDLFCQRGPVFRGHSGGSDRRVKD